jgi:hypothetical protein
MAGITVLDAKEHPATTISADGLLVPQAFLPRTRTWYVPTGAAVLCDVAALFVSTCATSDNPGAEPDSIT